MRSLIIDRILHEGGNQVTGYIPRSFCYFSKELKLPVNTMTKIWLKFCEELLINPGAKGGTIQISSRGIINYTVSVLKLTFSLF